MSSAAALPTGTVTFLFTDIEGSTRLLKQLRDDYGAALADHQRIIRAALAEHDGWEIDTQGDSFFAAFRRAKDAVGAAVAAQRALATGVAGWRAVARADGDPHRRALCRGRALRWPRRSPRRPHLGRRTREPGARLADDARAAA